MSEALRSPIPAPVEFAGQWVAWNRERIAIVAHGLDLSEVRVVAAAAAGQSNFILQYVRRPEERFIGAIRIKPPTSITG